MQYPKIETLTIKGLLEQRERPEYFDQHVVKGSGGLYLLRYNILGQCPEYSLHFVGPHGDKRSESRCFQAISYLSRR